MSYLSFFCEEKILNFVAEILNAWTCKKQFFNEIAHLEKLLFNGNWSYLHEQIYLEIREELDYGFLWSYRVSLTTKTKQHKWMSGSVNCWDGIKNWCDHIKIYLLRYSQKLIFVLFWLLFTKMNLSLNWISLTNIFNLPKHGPSKVCLYLRRHCA